MTQSFIEISILLTVGMHRSGTSLTAALLQSSGLHIGEKLMRASPANVKGHFENLDFYRFHERVLQSQAIDPAGWTLQKSIQVESAFIQLAHQLVMDNARSPAWGWKDPRTTLFLNFWANLLPNANFLLVYRAPWEVIDSLYRRGTDQVFLNQPDLAPKIWQHYNQNILDFLDRFPNRCLLVNVQTIVTHTQNWIDTLNQKFQLQLTAPDPALYEPSLLHQQSSGNKYPSLLQTYFPQVLETYEQLESKAWQPEPHLATVIPHLTPLPAQECTFQNWLDLRLAEKEQQTLKTQINQLQEQHKQLNQQHQHLQAELQQVRSQLQQLQQASTHS